MVDALASASQVRCACQLSKLHALLATFQVFTGEEWCYTMFIAMRNVDASTSLFFIGCLLLGRWMILNMYTAVILSALATQRRKDNGVADEANAAADTELKELKAKIESYDSAEGPSPAPAAFGAKGPHGADRAWGGMLRWSQPDSQRISHHDGPAPEAEAPAPLPGRKFSSAAYDVASAQAGAQSSKPKPAPALPSVTAINASKPSPLVGTNGWFKDVKNLYDPAHPNDYDDMQREVEAARKAQELEAALHQLL